MRRARDRPYRRRVRLVVSDQAVTMGWSFWGPLITDVVARLRSFDHTQIDIVRQFLVDMTDAVQTCLVTQRPVTTGDRKPSTPPR